MRCSTHAGTTWSRRSASSESAPAWPGWICARAVSALPELDRPGRAGGANWRGCRPRSCWWTKASAQPGWFGGARVCRARPPGISTWTRAARALCEQFGTRDLAGFGCADMHAGVVAPPAACCSTCATRSARQCPTSSTARERRDDAVLLDVVTRRNLEIERSLAGRDEYTLAGVMDRCATAMGSRLLRRWLNRPLRDQALPAPAAAGGRRAADDAGARRSWPAPARDRRPGTHPGAARAAVRQTPRPGPTAPGAGAAAAICAALPPVAVATAGPAAQPTCATSRNARTPGAGPGRGTAAADPRRRRHRSRLRQRNSTSCATWQSTPTLPAATWSAGTRTNRTAAR